MSAFPRFCKIFAPQATCLAYAQFCFKTRKIISRYFALSLYIQILKSNLQISASNFTHRDPRLKNVNLNLRRDSVKFKPARSAATSHVQWGRWGFGCGRGDALLRFARSCKQTVSRNPFRLPRKRERWIQKEALLLRLCLATAKQSAVQAPSPLIRKIKIKI